MKNDRRDFLKFLGYGALALTPLSSLAHAKLKQGLLKGKKLALIKGISPTLKDELALAPGLNYEILIRFGDRINPTEVFGFNNDYIATHQLAFDDLIMWVNHEYVNPLFVSGVERTKENVDIERKLVGGSLLRVKKKDGKWQFIADDKYNKGVRGDTKIPFANNEIINGKKHAIGTLANCAGGKTPWGTFLTCEENYDGFYGERQGDGSVSESWVSWEKFYPNPPEHYGWVVEIDPFTGKAQKHINLGRFAHESATCVKSSKGVVVYSGDDKKNEHIYKFVSESADNLDKGVLYVADLKQGRWLPLNLELSPKLKERFSSQQEVLINTRLAAKMLGATELDRPEDIEINPLTGDIFVALTNNKSKDNYHGQILKISESGGDYNSLTFKSEVFKLGGQESGFSCPDNLAFDRNGNLWFTTDISGSSIGKGKYEKFGNNGLFVVPARGKQAGLAIQVASAPVDAEFTGPCFSPDQKSLFLSVQHPGEESTDKNNPTSNWPTGSTPLPAVVVIEGELLESLTGPL